MKVKAIFEIDVETLKSVAETDDIDEAIRKEFGWVEQSGISLVDHEEVKE